MDKVVTVMDVHHVTPVRVWMGIVVVCQMILRAVVLKVMYAPVEAAYVPKVLRIVTAIVPLAVTR